MTDLATLGIAIDSSSVPSAIGKVRELGDAAAVTEKQVGSLTATAAAQIEIIANLGNSTATLTQKQIQAAGGWQALNSAYIASYNNQLQAAQAVINYADRVDKLLASVDKYSAAQLRSNNVIKEADALYEAGVLSAGNYALVLAANSNNFDKTAASITGTIQQLEKLKAIQQGTNFASDVNTLLGVGSVGKSAKDSASVFEDMLKQQEALDKLREAQASSNFQYTIAQAAEIDLSGKSAKESAAVFSELIAQEEIIERQKADYLSQVARTQVEYAKVKALQEAQTFQSNIKYASELGLSGKSAKQSASVFIEEEQLRTAAVVKGEKAQAEAAIASAAEMAAAEEIKRTAWAVTDGEMTKVAGASMQLHVSTSLIARETVTIFRELARGDFSRLAGSTTLLAQGFGALTAAILPFTAAFAAAIAIIAGFIALWADYDNHLATVNLSTVGLGTATGKTAEQLDELARKTAEAAGISENASAKNQLSLIRMGVTNTEVMTKIQLELKDYMAATGDKAPEALKTWAAAMKDPIKGAIDLNEKVGGLDGTTYELIKKLTEEGRILDADNLLIETFAAKTKNAAKEQSEFTKAIDGTKKAVGDFFLNTGKSLFGDAGDNQRASDYAGFPGAQSMADDKAAAKSKKEKAAATAAAAEEERQASLRAALAMDEYAPKYSKITELMNARKLVMDDIGRSGLSAKASDALSEIDKQIAKLKKQDVEHKSPQERYSDGTDKLNQQNVGLAKSIELYEKGDVAAAKYADAVGKANGEAAGKHISIGEAAARAQAILNNENLRAIETQVIKNNQTEASNNIQLRANKAVADGSLTVYQANQQIAQENALYQAGVVLAEAKGKKQQEAAQTAYDKQKQLIESGVYQKEISALQAANESYANQIELINLETASIGLSNKERAVRLAIAKEEQVVRSKGMENTPEGRKAISNAGLTAGLSAELNSIKSPLSSLEDETAKYNGQLIALRAQWAAGSISATQYKLAVNNIKQAQAEMNIANGKSTFADMMTTALGRLANTGKSTAQQLTDSFTQAATTIGDGLANSIGKAFVGTQKFGQAIRDVANNAVSDLIASLVKMGEQWLLQQLLGKAAMAATTSAGVAQAAVLTAAYTPAAVMASIMSFGAADAAAAAGMASTMAVGQALAMLHLANGGPVTGPGGPREDKVPAMLSAGEYVINAAAAAQHRPLLDAINKGQSLNNHFANGGSVGSVTYMPANNHAPISHTWDFRGANFGGANPADIEQRFRKIVEQEYAPVLLNIARQQASKDVSNRIGRQSLNGRTR